VSVAVSVSVSPSVSVSVSVPLASCEHVLEEGPTAPVILGHWDWSSGCVCYCLLLAVDQQFAEFWPCLRFCFLCPEMLFNYSPTNCDDNCLQLATLKSLSLQRVGFV